MLNIPFEFNSIPGDLFIAGGQTSSPIADVEIVDLNPDDPIQLPCFIPEPLPRTLGETVGTYSLGFPWVCGGTANLDCFKYDVANDQWLTGAAQLDIERRLAAGVMLSETEWWITGGDQDLDSIGTDTTMIYDTEAEEVRPYVDLPERMWRHNIFRVDDTTIFLIGGDLDGKAWFFDTESETFTEVFDERFEYFLGFAGLVEKDDGTQLIVVTGGFQNRTLTEILDLSTMQWRQGPDFANISNGASVPYGKTFLAVGGIDPRGEVDDIYAFEPNAEEWVELSRVMTQAREWLPPVVVPPGFVECG